MLKGEEMNNQLRTRAPSAGFACEADIIPSGAVPLGQGLSFPHLPHPHSHIIYAWPLPLPSIWLLPCQKDLPLACVNSPGATLCAHQPPQSSSLWIMKAASLLGHLRALGEVLRNPSESQGFMVPIQRTAGSVSQINFWFAKRSLPLY